MDGPPVVERRRWLTLPLTATASTLLGAIAVAVAVTVGPGQLGETNSVQFGERYIHIISDGLDSVCFGREPPADDPNLDQLCTSPALPRADVSVLKPGDRVLVGWVSIRLPTEAEDLGDVGTTKLVYVRVLE